jgi:hypothetical protein
MTWDEIFQNVFDRVLEEDLQKDLEAEIEQSEYDNRATDDAIERRQEFDRDQSSNLGGAQS